MKCLAIIGLLLLVGVGSALSLDFQNAGDMNSLKNPTLISPGTSFLWVQNTTGGNSYLDTVGSNKEASNPTALPMTYSAATSMPTNAWGCNRAFLFDSAGNQIADVYNGGMDSGAPHRFELKMQGLQANMYRDGSLLVQSAVLAVNPTYIGWGGQGGRGLCDDIVWGTADSPYVFGMPEANAYVISRDFTNPSASGFYRYNGTLINSNNMTTTFSKNNGDNETLYLANTDTGVIYATYYTGTAYTGSVAWDLNALFNNNAPMGRYRTYIDGHGYSQSIFYIGAGASINFNSHTYSQQDVATITYAVSTGAYWNTGLYNYRIIIQDIYGTEINNQAITTQTGSVTYTWKTTDAPNVYYAVIQALDKTTGEVIWMNFDYTTLNAYTTFSGHVYDCNNGTIISGAVVNITQNSVTSVATTPADGNYSLTGYYSGVTTDINLTASGYNQYHRIITPMRSGTIHLNLTTWPLSTSTAGVGIGGCAREGVLSGINITQGYGAPISSVGIHAINSTEHNQVTANNVGGYLGDETASWFLTSGRIYDLWGQKTGFLNSPNYTVVTP